MLYCLSRHFCWLQVQRLSDRALNKLGFIMKIFVFQLSVCAARQIVEIIEIDFCFRLVFLIINSDASRYLVEILTPVSAGEREKWLDRIIEGVHKQSCKYYNLGQLIKIIYSL